MQADNPFDRMLVRYRANRNAPQDFLDAACWVVDSMDLARAAAETLFDAPSQETVIAIYDRFIRRMQDRRYPVTADEDLFPMS